MIVVNTRLLSHDVTDAEVRARVLVEGTTRVIWSMSLGVDPVAKGTSGTWVALGSGRALRGNRLEVSAVVMDVGEVEDDLVCVLQVEGPELTASEMRHAAGHGDAAAYAMAVLFQ
jgi:hypothetical protein